VTTATTVGVTTFSTPADNEILIEREFDAPRELVWEALTTPEHMFKWFNPVGTTLTECEADLRPGGRYRNVWTRDDFTLVMGGEFREVEKPRRIVNTESMEGYPGESVNEVTLEETQNGRTRFSCRSIYESKEMRDAVIASGMQNGAAESYDLLNEFLQTLR
jgi:uncharacterized protein YndB with AHSA1/START domain